MIKEKIQQLELFLEHAEEICQMAKKEINTRIWAIRKTCPHNNVKYVPDASGNNDSFEYCEDCGFESKRINRA